MEKRAAPGMCVGGCGFHGSASTMDMCSQCYRAAKKKRRADDNDGKDGLELGDRTVGAATGEGDGETPRLEAPKTVGTGTATDTAAGKGGAEASAEASDPAVSARPSSATAVREIAAVGSETPPVKQKNRGRCFACRRKTGLTGFTCRCGYTFCTTHRYADAHDCEFDYKGAGRDELSKSNPLVVADKVEKI